jgi:Mn2+/Fe2+ NRAMP family transporter
MSNPMKLFFNLVSFIALVAIGVALLLAFVFKDNSISGALTVIAQVLAYIVVIFYAFIYAYRGGRDSKGKWTNKQTVNMCIWLVATIFVIVFVILNTQI